MNDTIDTAGEQAEQAVEHTETEQQDQHISPENLPDELKPIYKSMQADYTRKMQALADERRKLHEPAPEILPEQDDTDLLKKTATEMLTQSMPDFDPENPAHEAMVQSAMADIRTRMDTASAVRQKLLDTARAEPRLAEVDGYAARLFSALPEHEQHILRSETAQGNTRPALAFWQDARRRFYAEHSRKQHTPAPPKAAPASAHPAPANPAIAPSDFRSMTDDDKARSLVKLGLV